MGGIFRLGELQARKAALVAESEVYRQTLRLELQNLRLCVLRARKNASFFSSSAPWLLMSGPLIRAWIGSLFGRRRFGRMRLLTTVLLGWQMYRKLAPIWQQFFGRRGFRAQPKRPTDEKAPAANI